MKVDEFIHPTEYKKLTQYSPLVVMSVLGLIVGAFVTIISSQQSQDNRSLAATYQGDYTGNLIGTSHTVRGSVNGNIMGGSNTIDRNVNGDVIGNSNTIRGYVTGCVRGNSNTIEGRVFGTVNGTSNTIRGGFGTGPCIGSQTATPSASVTAPTTSPQIATPTVVKTGPIQPPPSGAGRILTVAKDGTGMYTSLQTAADASEPGDTIVVAGGTYTGKLDIRKSGTPRDWIHFQNKTGERVVLDGTGIAGEGTITVFDHSNLRFSGINVVNSQAHGIFTVRSNNIIVENCEVSYSRYGGIVLVGNDIGRPSATNALVNNCDVHHNNSIGLSARNEAITISNYDGFEVKNNKVYDNGEEGIDAKYEATNGSIHHNESRNNNGPNIYIDAANTIKIYNNIVSGAKDRTKSGIGLAVETISVSKKTHTIDIYNNVVYGNALGGVGFWIETTGSFADIRIVNNTMFNNKTADIYAYQTLTFTGNNVIRNNILWSAVDGLSSPLLKDKLAADHNLLASSKANLGLTDMVAGNARLVAGSAAIDGGVAEFAPVIDMDGKSRPAGNAYDIGAFEFGGVAGPYPTMPAVFSTIGVSPTAIRLPTPTIYVPTPTARPASTGQTYTISPIADAYANSEAKTTNYGNTTILNVDSNPSSIAYLKFDLTPFAGKTITKAQLRIRTATDPSKDKQRVRSVTNIPWTETTLTYDNRPLITNSSLATINSGNDTNEWQQVTLTQTIAANAGNLLSLAIDTNGDNNVWFWSKESTSKPELIIQTK